MPARPFYYTNTNPNELTPDERDRAVGRLLYLSDDLLIYHFQCTDPKEPDKYHTVHLDEWECSGACSCEDFEIRIRPLLESKSIKPHSARARCKHIDKADRILSYKAKRRLVTQRTNPKRI